MLTISYILSGTLLVLACTTGLLGLKFIAPYLKPIEQNSNDENPKVGILLPLRGSDPFLERCITALLEQEYENYVIRIVIDSDQDPAREIVEKALKNKNSDNVTLEFLSDFTETCSLKSCALRQAYQSLPDDCEIIIEIDADAYPDPSWISDMVDGFSDPTVGVACGVRWYSPLHPTLPNLARHVWNAGAVTQMRAMNIGWGGSFAIKKEAFEKANLYDHWGTSLFEDTYSTNILLDHGYKLKVLPNVTMINEESISYRHCFKFITRQLINIRLYHRSWPIVSTFGLFSFFVAMLSILFCPIAYFSGETEASTIVCSSIISYYLFQAILVWYAEFVIGSFHKRIGKPKVRMSPWTLPIGVFIALVFYPLALINAMMTKTASWRGINYEFSSPDKVKRLNYEPLIHGHSSRPKSL